MNFNPRQDKLICKSISLPLLQNILHNLAKQIDKIDDEIVSARDSGPEDI